MSNNVQPIFIMPEGTIRNTGKNAQKNNISAAKAVADTIRTTLGPKGMDKMLVDSMGDIIITNDGVTILDEMEIEHPAAKMIVEVAKVQEDEIGDGTTTAVILSGELLKNAEALLDKNIHPTIIAKGYKLATEKIQEILGELGKKVSIDDKDILIKIAKTAMNSKNVELARDRLAKLAVEAILKIVKKQGAKFIVNIEDIKLEKKEGKSVIDSELIEGIVIDKERSHSNMPSLIEDAKIALLNCALEIKEPGTDAKIQITNPDQLQSFVEQEEMMLKDMVEKVSKTKANVVFCQKGIDDLAQHHLAKKGILAVRRVSKTDMEAIAKATGGEILNNLADIKSADLGSAGLVEEKKLGKDKMIFIEKCQNPKAVSLIIRGGTEHVVTEIERAITDAIGDLAAAITVGKCVAGGGSIELELSKRLKQYSEQLSGREQLAVRAFADTLEIIPRTLAENAGMDPIDVLTELKSRHDKGEEESGWDLFLRRPTNMWEKGVIEPLKIKTQAINSASDATIMLLRIDDIISAGKLSKDSMPAMPGAPGMQY